MTRWMAAALCALLLAPAALACRSNDDPAAQDDPISEQADAGDDGADGADDAADAGTEADDAAADAGAADGDAEAVDEPTPDPTIVALAQSFTPPIKGDPDAPVMIYEFSDYL